MGVEQVFDISKFQFLRVIEVSEITSGERLVFDSGDKAIALFNISGVFYAIGDVCTHDNGPLGDGELEGFEVICPRHGAHFDVRNGQAVKKPAVMPAPWFPTRIVEGWVEVGIPVEL